MKKQIAILGSTGSIGTQALQVIEEHPDRYEAYVLTCLLYTSPSPRDTR